MSNTKPTKNEVPSNAVSDLLFNSEKLDEVVNSESLTYVDRKENTRLTIKGLEKAAVSAGPTVDAALQALEQANEAKKNSDAIVAVTGEYISRAETAATESEGSAVESASSAQRSEAAADKASAIVNAEIYADVASGLAATTEGKSFAVYTALGVSYYRKVNGLAVLSVEISGQEAVTDLQVRSRIGINGAWENNTLYPFDSLASPNENSLQIHADTKSVTTYREAYSALTQKIVSGDVVTVKYKYAGSGVIPTLGLKTSKNGVIVSNRPTLSLSSDYIETQLVATADTATLLVVFINNAASSDISLDLIVSINSKNAITDAVLNLMNDNKKLYSEITFGNVKSWVNSSGYPFKEFSQRNTNKIIYDNSRGVYSEMYAFVDVKSGGSLNLNYSLNTESGRLFARLAKGSAWSGDEVQLSSGGARQSLSLKASSDATSIKFYSKAESSVGSIFVEVNSGKKNAITEQSDAIYSAIGSANAILAILSQSSTFDMLTKSSPYTYELSDAGTAYKQIITSINTITGAASVKLMYKINSSNAALRIQSRNGSAWGGGEKQLVADGNYHEVDLAIIAGNTFSGWGIYSQAKSGGYSADITMIPISADGVFFTPATAVLYETMKSTGEISSRVEALESGGSAVAQNTDVIFPAYFYAVDGRPLRFYGANMISGDRPWSNNTDIVLSSHGYEGKPVLLKDAVPDAMIMPSEINGSTLNINARADKSSNISRKKALFTTLPATQSGDIKVACIMDSLGERCVPWLYFAVNATGAKYVGVGSRTTRGLTDTGTYILPNTPSAGIPFDGRGGWTTFDYLGKTQKMNFSQPFLRDAVAADFAAYPQYCYDKSYSGQSYSDNPNLAGYHIFDVTAWMSASGINASDKLVVVIQLGYNDLYYDYTAQQTALSQEFMIAKFRERLPNSRFVISHQAFGWSGVSKPKGWPGFAKWISQKLRQFDNRLSDKIIVAPAWAQLSYKYGMSESVTATSDTGVQTVSLVDDVHPGELAGAQWGDALLAPVLAAWNLDS